METEEAEEKKQILVAEDNASNYKLIQFILGRQYSVIHANDGSEAIELYKKLRPDLILMDISMPGMDGYMATEEIRKISPDVPIIGLTAYAYATDREKGIECGMNDYMTKPIIAATLRAKIKETIGE